MYIGNVILLILNLTASFDKQVMDGSLISAEQIELVTCTILGVIAAQIMEADKLIQTIGGKR